MNNTSDGHVVEPVRGWILPGFVNNLCSPNGRLIRLGAFTVMITPDTTIGVTTILILLIMSLCAVLRLLFVATLD